MLQQKGVPMCMREARKGSGGTVRETCRRLRLLCPRHLVLMSSHHQWRRAWVVQHPQGLMVSSDPAGRDYL